MRMPKPPASMKGQRKFPNSLAPILGFDNRKILEELGIDNDTILRMEDREKQNREMLKVMMQVSDEQK